MAISYATITGKLYNPAGQPLANRKVRIYATSDHGTLRSVGDGLVFGASFYERTGSDGSLTVVLPKLPQIGLEPSSNVQWCLEYPEHLKMAPLYFTLSADTTWAALTQVSAVNANENTITTLNSLMTDLAMGYDPAGIRKALSPWFASLMTVDTAPAYAFVIGDSVGEGNVAGGFTARWQYLLQASLRAAFPVTGVSTPGIGWIPASTVTGAPAAPTTLVAPYNLKTDQNGAGVKAVRVSNAGYVEWAAQQCDRIRVWYAKRATFAGNGEVKVDGVVKATFNSNSGGGTSDGYTADSGALSAGSHTLRVTGTSAAGVEAIVTAAEFFNGDYGKGVHIVDGAHFGANTATFLTSEALTGHWQVAAAIKPQLYIVMLGLNDWGSLTLAQYLANIDSILAQCAAANGTTPYSVLLVMPYQPVKASPGTAEDWEAMRIGLYNRSSSNVAVFDLGRSWPDLVADGGTESGVMYEDALPLHPNAAGHKLMARIFHRILAA